MTEPDGTLAGSRDAEGGGGARAVLDALWNGSAPIAIIDRELRVGSVNAAGARLAGLPAQELVGRPAEELLGPRARVELRTLLDTGVAVTAAAVHLEPSQGSAEAKHWLASIQPVRDETGDVFAACVVLSDVTGWRRADAAAREARVEAELAIQALIRLQAVTASLAAALTPAEVARVVMEQGVGLLDAAAGSISWTTGRDELEVLDAFGYPERALVAWRRYAVDLPAPLAEAFRTARPVWLESPEEHDARYPHLADAARPFAGASVAVPLMAGERVVGVLGIDFDAPRRLDAADRSVILAIAHQTAQALERARLYDQQQALRAHAEQTAALLDTMFSSVPIGLAFVDWDLRLMHVNAGWGRVHGNAPAACVGKAVTEAFPGEPGTVRAARWRRVLASGEAILEVEENRSEPDDPASTRTWLESCYPVVAGGDTIGLAVVAREITSDRRAEAFRRNLLGIVGHDLRNPLGAITGFAHVLRNAGGLDERQLRAVDRIEACALKAARIAHDLLDLTRIESMRGIPIEPRAARADEICGAVAAEVETAFPERQVRIAGRGDPAVRWDPDRVSQALSNLVVNGLKHGAPDQPVTIEWEAAPHAVAVHVRNRGAPIPSSIRGHLFEPFRQGPQAGARESGVGLGLYIAQEIARAHGGSLEVGPAADEWTTFTLRLPREASL